MFNSPPQIFYHAIDKGAEWREIANEQIDRIIDSKLLDNGHLHINCHYNIENWKPFIEKYKDFSNHITWYIGKGSPEDKEIPTFILMNDFVSNNPNVDFPMLYIHMKGVTYQGTRAGCPEPTKKWRWYMDYFAVTRWRDCVSKLEEGYDTCGVERKNPGPTIKYGHYSGTTHWVTSNFFRTIPRLGLPSKGEIINPVPHGEQTYMVAEMIYGTSNNRWYSFCQIDQNLYAYEVEPAQYQIL